MRKNSLWWTFPCALLILLGVAASQSSHSTRSVSVNGHTGETIIYQIDGRSYVDLESLVRIANGSISYHGDQITVTFPTAEQTSTAGSGSATGGTSLSQPFMTASIQALGILKDWTNTLAYAVQKGVPGDGSRLIVFHDRAAEALRHAQVAASSSGDQDALQLVSHHFNTVNAWNDKLVGERRRMDTGKYSVAEDALKNDETYQKISSCMKFLNTMIPRGIYRDDNACH